MNGFAIDVLQAIYTLSDEVEYNNYDAVDVAEYLEMELEPVQAMIKALYIDGYLGECMTLEDDGIETYHVTLKAMCYVE